MSPMHVAELLLGVALVGAAAGCIAESEPLADPRGDESPEPVGGKADSPAAPTFPYDWDAIAARCTPPGADEPIVYGNDFRWDYSPDEMAQRAEEIYASGKRLSARARFDEETGSFVLPASDAWGGDVTLPRRLVESVTAHIERALAEGHARHVFFPDMGHSHYFVPQERWEAEYAGTPVGERAAMYGRMLDEPSLLVLYHAAEQLQMLDEDGELLPDPSIQQRHHDRNIVGDNEGQGRLELLQNPDSPANTARDYPGHRYYGAGFNVSASEDACFPFLDQGELKYYDLSLEDLPYPSAGGGGDFF